MTIKRFLTLPALLSGLLVVCLLMSPVVGNGRDKPSDSHDGSPSLWAEVSWAEGQVTTYAEGVPGAPLALSVSMVSYAATGNVTTQFSIPGVFDANGEYVIAVQLSSLLSWTDFDLMVEVDSVGFNGLAQRSSTWGLRKRTFDPSDPNAPVAPSGGSGLIAAPGTQAPLLPYSWASMTYQSDIVLFQCAPTGIEGVIPVN
jgi:hypothetical protein